LYQLRGGAIALRNTARAAVGNVAVATALAKKFRHRFSRSKLAACPTIATDAPLPPALVALVP
jgi:hypothetical protein